MAQRQEAWTRPSTRTEIIDQLVDGVDRYNPANVNILEDYLYHQIREQEYDCLANLAILKLCETRYPRPGNRFTDFAYTYSYQFNPELYTPDVVINILVKALTAAPAPDFNLCVGLLGERQVRYGSFSVFPNFQTFCCARSTSALFTTAA